MSEKLIVIIFKFKAPLYLYHISVHNLINSILLHHQYIIVLNDKTLSVETWYHINGIVNIDWLIDLAANFVMKIIY